MDCEEASELAGLILGLILFFLCGGAVVALVFWLLGLR